MLNVDPAVTSNRVIFQLYRCLSGDNLKTILTRKAGT